MDDTIAQAVKYISDRLKDDPDLNKMALIEETCQRFDLNPLQNEFLINKYIRGL